MSVDNDFVESLPTGYRINGVAHFVQNTKPTGSAIAVGDRWYKPLDSSEWYWSGTYWLSLDFYTIKSDYKQDEITTSKSLSGSSCPGRPLSTGKSGVYFLSASVDFYPYQSTSAVDYWIFTHEVYYTDGTTETVASNSGASKTGSNWTHLETTINSPKNSLTKTILLAYCASNKVGTPPTCVCMTSLDFRYIHP
jgi:hypothetical protein